MKTISAKSIIEGQLSDAEKEFISETVARLGRAQMTESAHGYRKGAGETIRDAAERGRGTFTINSQSSSAIAIMDVILAANRDYNRQVLGNINRIRASYKSLTIKQLEKMVKAAGTAGKFKEIWGHNDERKFQILTQILAVFVPRLQDTNSPEDDFKVMSDWARNADLSSMSNDPVGSIHNVGIATFQHLRMTFGVDTVKPDRRVKDVLRREFNMSVSDKKSIQVVERMAEVLGISTLLLDQIFVKYGSGHYRCS